MSTFDDPRWWLDQLHAELKTRQTGMAELDDFYTGNHPMPFLTSGHKRKLLDGFRKLIEDSRSNFMRLVVDAVEERLRVEGFRLSASRTERADKKSWDTWQANQMDAQSQVAFTEALVKGVSYLSVWFDSDGDGFADIAVEDPMQTIVAYDPASNYRRRRAALKVWLDDWTGMERANVYLPDAIHKFQAKRETEGRIGTASGLSSENAGKANWEEIEVLPNELGVVPIIPLRNRPRLLVEGESEIADVWRVQNQINGLLFLLALAGYFGAHRQRWATGYKVEQDAAGKTIQPFDITVDQFIFNENPEGKFGDFEQTDLTGYIKAIEQKVLHIAVTTRTPRHYLIEQGQSPSGDAIKSAESGLTKKVQRKQPVFGEGLEEAIRLARRFQGEGEAPPDSEILWGDAEVHTEAEKTDAAIKRFQARLTTWEQTCRDLGYSPQTISRMLKEFGGNAPEPESVQLPPAA